MTVEIDYRCYPDETKYRWQAFSYINNYCYGQWAETKEEARQKLIDEIRADFPGLQETVEI